LPQNANRAGEIEDDRDADDEVHCMRPISHMPAGWSSRPVLQGAHGRAG
jgi:hypothetical protein